MIDEDPSVATITEERAAKGLTFEEEFMAPDDACALSRAESVATGAFKLWRGDILVCG